MDNLSYYEKRVKAALDNELPDDFRDYFKEYRDMCRMALAEKFDVGVVSLSALLDCLVDFICPLRKCNAEIVKRILENRVYKSDNYEKLKTKGANFSCKELFDGLTQSVSPAFARFLVDKLNAKPLAKDELWENLKESKDYAQFKQTIKEYDIDYTSISNCMAYVLADERWNNILNELLLKTYDTSDGCSEEECITQSANRVIESGEIHLYETETDDYANERMQKMNLLKNKFEELKSRNFDNGSILLFELFYYITDICWDLQEGYECENYRYIETDTISKFIQRKRKSLPFVEIYFDTCTTGQILTPTFEINKGCLIDEFDEARINEFSLRLLEWTKSEDAKKYNGDANVTVNPTDFFVLPDELNKDIIPETNMKPIDIFRKALDKEIIIWNHETKKVEWNRSKQALDFFAGKIYSGDAFDSETDCWYIKDISIPKSLLENIFTGNQSIGAQRSNLKNKKSSHEKGPARVKISSHSSKQDFIEIEELFKS